VFVRALYVVRTVIKLKLVDKVVWVKYLKIRVTA